MPATTVTKKYTSIHIPKVKEYSTEDPLTKERFLQILREGDERFERGEYKTEDEMWELIEELKDSINEHYNKSYLAKKLQISIRILIRVTFLYNLTFFNKNSSIAKLPHVLHLVSYQYHRLIAV